MYTTIDRNLQEYFLWSYGSLKIQTETWLGLGRKIRNGENERNNEDTHLVHCTCTSIPDNTVWDHWSRFVWWNMNYSLFLDFYFSFIRFSVNDNWDQNSTWQKCRFGIVGVRKRRMLHHRIRYKVINYSYRLLCSKLKSCVYPDRKYSPGETKMLILFTFNSKE